MHGLLVAVASLVGEHRLSNCLTHALVAPRHGESSQAGIEPISLALADGFLTTGLLGTSNEQYFKQVF